jgi:DNA polymerase-3 subunit delta'
MNEFWENETGQYDVKKILGELIKRKRVPHAFIFSGQDGVGKFHTAIQFSNYISKELDFTNETTLKKINLLQEPFVKLIFPLPRGKGETAEDSATEKLNKEQIELIQNEIKLKVANPYHRINIEGANTIKINSIRDINKFISTSFTDLGHRFIFIIDAHMMNEQAQNALLKNLEEPPKGIIFYLLTNEKTKLLPTIKSRCWDIEFKPLSRKSIKNLLINNYGINIQSAELISLFAQGSITNALDLYNADLVDTLEKTISILRYSIGKRYYSAIHELNKIVSVKSVEEFRKIISLIKIWLGDVNKNKHSEGNFYFEDYSDTLSKFNEKYSSSDLEKVFISINLLEEQSKQNLNLNVLTLNLIFELASLSIRK